MHTLLSTATTALSPLFAPVVTQAAVFGHDLFRRDMSTCGFVSGDAASPLTCGAGYNCATQLGDINAFACCNDVECAGSKW